MTSIIRFSAIKIKIQLKPGLLKNRDFLFNKISFIWFKSYLLFN